MNWLCLLLVPFAADTSTSPATGAMVRPISGVVLTLLDEASVPAREAGVLTSITARVGQTVEQGQVLGTIDERDALLRKRKAESELQQAQQAAENDIKIRFARKSADVAVAELDRAKEAAAKFNKSVSQTEIDRLQLLADKAELEIEQAQLDVTAAGLVRDLKARDLELADLSIAHRKITAPLTGMVVQWRQHLGEWVEPGLTVVRIIRLNRLKAEGFAPATELTAEHVGRPVKYLLVQPDGSTRAFAGEIAFVSPEIDPVNGQVRFWAEIDNPKLELRPGQIGILEFAR